MILSRRKLVISTYLRIPKGCLMVKRFLQILPIYKNIFDGCVAIVQNNFDRYRFYGPTADEVVKDIDLSDKTCLITGANSGIGLEITRCLNARGCSVLMACRNTYEARIVGKKMCENYDRLHFYDTNLCSLNSVKKTSNLLLQLNRKIDMVILNAGVFGLPWTLTEDGLETTFQVNYLSQYFLLRNIDRILAPNVRVVFVSSESHRHVKWPLSNILDPTIDMLSLPEDQYTSIRAYNVSKLCGITAMHYLGYCWLHTEKQIFCAHPGSFIKTKLCRNWWIYEALYFSMRPFSKSISQGASVPLFCATSPELNGLSGLYIKDLQPYNESELADDLKLAFRLQDLTNDLLSDRAVTDDVTQFASFDAQEQNKDTITEDDLVTSCSN